MTVIKKENVIYNESMPQIYHSSWLETAIHNFKKADCVHALRGDLTIDEFIKSWCKEELRKAVKLD